MKKIFFFTLLFLGGTVIAQKDIAETNSPHQKVHPKDFSKRLEKLKTEYDLSPEQVAKLEKVLEAKHERPNSKSQNQEKINQKRENWESLSEEERETLKAERREQAKTKDISQRSHSNSQSYNHKNNFEEDLLKILTKEQADKYHANKTERMNRMEQNRGTQNENKDKKKESCSSKSGTESCCKKGSESQNKNEIKKGKSSKPQKMMKK